MLKHFIQKHAFFLGIIALCGIIALVFFAHRTQLLSRYDNEYVRDLYDHSQWTIAKSVRSISDEELYQVGGYDFIRTQKFFFISPEVPVLSKYMFGWVIALFGNANVIGFISYLLSLFLLFCIARKIVSAKQSLLITVLYAMEPLVTSHAGEALLDLPQLVCLLIHIYAMLTVYQNKKKIFISVTMLVLAGISLGAFISFKFGWLGLIILSADAYLFWKMKKIWQIIIIGTVAGLFYGATYIQYFLQGNSILDFLKVQKWVVLFYVNSKAPRNPLNEIASILFGLIRGWNKGAVWARVSEWTLLWPIYGISTVLLVKNVIKKKLIFRQEISYLLVLAVLLFLSYLIIPFFARYLILLLPLLILIFVATVPKQLHKYFLHIIIIATLFFALSLPSSPNGFIDAMTAMWSKGIYQDMYRFLDVSTKQNTSRLAFWREQQQFEKDWGVHPKTITAPNLIIFPWQTRVTVSLTIPYDTELGAFSFEKSVLFQRVANNWQMVWDDTYRIPIGNNRYQLLKNIIHTNYGSLINSDTGEVLIHQGNWPFLSVTPAKISNDKQLIEQLKALTGLSGYDIEAKYKANAQPDWHIPITYLRRDFSVLKLEIMELDPGISWELRPTYVYEQLNNLQYKGLRYDELFQTYRISLESVIGGTIGIIDLNTGKQTIYITRNGEDGGEVKLSTAEIYQVGKK